MKYVVVPEDIAIVDRRNGNRPIILKRSEEEEGEPYVIKFRDFVLTNIVDSPAMVRGGGEGIRRARKIEALFQDARPGDVVGVEDADYRIIRNIVDHIEWSPTFARHATQIEPFIAAWEAAERQDDKWKRKRDAEAAKSLLDGVPADAPVQASA